MNFLHDFPIPSGMVGQLLLAYTAGLGTVLTPCIYPLIPVTISLFGVASHLSRWKAFLLSACYVAGICVTYTVLGLVSAKTSHLFGAMLGNPFVATLLATFFAVMACFALDLLHIPAIGKIQNKCSQVGGTGYGGAFLMGSVSGFVAAPCAGPILAGILTLAAQQHSTDWAGLLLFVYAMGFGTVFLILGTFSNLIQKLPRPGAWMNSIKFLTASALFAVAMYLVSPFIAFQSTSFPTWQVTLVVCVAVLGGYIASTRHLSAIKFCSALLLAVAGLQLITGGDTGAGSASATDQTIEWDSSIDGALLHARSKHSIAMVDFFADWCAACKELDRVTYVDPKVQTRIHAFALGKIDFTQIDDDKQALLTRYQIPGLPAVLFLNPDGTEIPGSRISGFLNPDDFITRIDRVENSTSHK